MSEIPEPAPIPIAYAQGATFQRAVVRPTWLVIPNLLAVSFLFLPYIGDTVFDELIKFAQHLFPAVRGHELWDAMICAPFVLSIPLALWTMRLAIRPTPKKFERSIAWAASCASIAVTLITFAYAAFI